jgi:hypothetical protein
MLANNAEFFINVTGISSNSYLTSATIATELDFAINSSPAYYYNTLFVVSTSTNPKLPKFAGIAIAELDMSIVNQFVYPDKRATMGNNTFWFASNDAVIQQDGSIFFDSATQNQATQLAVVQPLTYRSFAYSASLQGELDFFFISNFNSSIGIPVGTVPGPAAPVVNISVVNQTNTTPVSSQGRQIWFS